MESAGKQPSWIRGAQIGLGALIIILSIMIIFNPVLTTVTLVFLLGIALLFLGIERVIIGIFLSKSSRLATVGLGIICIAFAILFMTFPKGSTTTLVIIAAIALLFGGIAKIAEGLRKKELKTWQKWSSVGVGALAPCCCNFYLCCTWLWNRACWSDVWDCPCHYGHPDDIFRIIWNNKKSLKTR